MRPRLILTGWIWIPVGIPIQCVAVWALAVLSPTLATVAMLAAGVLAATTFANPFLTLIGRTALYEAKKRFSH